MLSHHGKALIASTVQGAPGALAKRKALDAAFHEDLLPGVEQSLVQIAVMIGVTRRQYRFLLTEQTPV